MSGFGEKDLQQVFEDFSNRLKILEIQVGEQLTKAYGKGYEKPRFISAKDEEECKAKGGKWDEENQKCLLVPKKPGAYKTGESFEISIGEVTLQDQSTKETRVFSVLPQERTTGEQFQEDLDETARLIMFGGMEHQKRKPLLE